MTYREYIRSELLARATERYPNNPRLQMLYTIGFLQAQLGEAMRADNWVYHRFKQSLTEAADRERELE